MPTVNLFSDVTAVSDGPEHDGHRVIKTFELVGNTTSGAGAVTAEVQGRNNGTAWSSIGTIDLVLGVTPVADAFSSDDRFLYLRGRVTAISGTGATCSLNLGV